MDKLEIIDVDTVANILGVSDRQVRTWIKDFGCPSRKDGRSLTFYWPDVRAWYVGYESAKASGPAGDFAPDSEEDDSGETLQAATLRKTRAEADLKTLTLSKLRRETINIDDAKAKVERAFGNLRTALLGMPPKLATRLAGIKDPAEMEAIAKEEMEALCRELSTGKMIGIADEPGDDEDTVDALSAAAEDVVTPQQLDALLNDLIHGYTLLAAAEDAHARLGS